MCVCVCRLILGESGLARYLHSAVVLSGTLLVFGGNTHNDTSLSNGAKCFSADFMAYDIGKKTSLLSVQETTSMLMLSIDQSEMFSAPCSTPKPTLERELSVPVVEIFLPNSLVLEKRACSVFFPLNFEQTFVKIR